MVASLTSWDPSKTSPNISVDAATDNYVCEVTGPDNNLFYYTAKAVTGLSLNTGSDRVYWEVEISGSWDNVQTYAFVGVSRIGAPFEPQRSLTSYDNEAILRSDGRLFSGNSPSLSRGFSSGDTVGILLDLPNETLSWYINGIWQGFFTSSIDRNTPYYPVWGSNKQGAIANIRDGIQGQIAANLQFNSSVPGAADFYTRFNYDQQFPSTYYGFSGLDGSLSADQYRYPERGIEQSLTDHKLNRGCLWPYEISVVPGYSPIFWDPSRSSGTLLFADRNLVVSGTQIESASTNSSRSFGLWYCEIKILQGDQDISCGIVTGKTMLPYTPGFNDQSWALSNTNGGRLVHNNQLLASDLTFQSGDTVMIAMDLDRAQVWFGVNGSWVNGGDPANGTDASFISLPLDNNDFYISVGSSSAQPWSVQGCFYAETFNYLIPASFSALDLTLGPPSSSGKTPQAWSPDSVSGIELPPAEDPLFEYVKCLIISSGEDGSSEVSDLSTLELDVGLFGDAHVSNEQSKFGSVSFKLDGSGDYIETSFNPEINLADDDFTVESWFYLTQTGSNDRVFQQRQGTNGNSYSVEIDATSINFTALPQGSGSVLGGFLFNANVPMVTTINQWHHIVLQRVGDDFAGYLDGVQIFTATTSSTVMQTMSPIRLGDSLVGYIDSFRLTVGAARYTTNNTNAISFVPPTEPFPQGGSNQISGNPVSPCWDTTVNTASYIYGNENPTGCFTFAEGTTPQNKTTWADANHARMRGNGVTSGAWYIEIDTGTISDLFSAAIGFATADNWGTNAESFRIGSLAFGQEDLANGWFSWWMNQFGPWTFGSIGNNGTLMIGIDLDNNEVRIGRNGTWDVISSLSNDLIIQFRNQGTIIGAEIWDDNQMILRNIQDYLYDPPSGYIAGWGADDTVPETPTPDPTDPALLVLSNDNRTATGTGAVDATYKITASETANIYTEFYIDSASPQSLIAIGVKNETQEYLYHSDGSVGPFGQGTAGDFSTYSTGDTVGLAIDYTTNEIWFTRNGVLIQPGEPQNNINPLQSLDKDICIHSKLIDAAVTINMGDEPFVADLENAYLRDYESAGCGMGGFYPAAVRRFTETGVLYPYAGEISQNGLVWTGSSSLAPTVWDPATSPAMIITNNGRTINQPLGGLTAGGTAYQVSSGKYYWEVFMDRATGAMQNGVRRGLGTTQLGRQSGGVGWIPDGRIQFSGGIISGNPTYTTGDTLMFALDMDTKQLYIGKNGTWQTNHDPTLGQPGIITGLVNAYGPAVGNGASGSSGNWLATANFGQDTFLYSPPAGFLAGFGSVTSISESVIAGNLSASQNVYAEFRVLDHEFNGYIRIGDERFTDGRICDPAMGCSDPVYTDWSAGDVINVAANTDNQYWIGINGVWLFGGNPALAINPTSAFTTGDSLAVGLDMINPGDSKFSVEFNAGIRPFEYSVPAGYQGLEPLENFVGTVECDVGGPSESVVLSSGFDIVNLSGLYLRGHLTRKNNDFETLFSSTTTGFTIWEQYVDFLEARNGGTSKLAPFQDYYCYFDKILTLISEAADPERVIVPFEQLISGYTPFIPFLDSFAARNMLIFRYPDQALAFVLISELHTWARAPEKTNQIKFFNGTLLRQLAIINIPFFYIFGHKTSAEAPTVTNLSDMFEAGVRLSIEFMLQELPKGHTTIKRDAGQIISMGFSKPQLQINKIDGAGFTPSFYAVPPLIKPNLQKISYNRLQFPAIETGRINGNTL